MVQQWKLGRMKKSLFIKRPLRELNVYELDLLAWLEKKLATSEAYRNTLKATLFNPDLKQVKEFRRKEYKQYFYNEGKKVKGAAPRRYYAQPQILGWDIFWAVDDAGEAGRVETYEDYLTFLQEEVTLETFHKGLVNLAVSLVDMGQLKEMLDQKKLQEWILTVATWYANSFFVTPFEGKKKELYAHERQKKVIEESFPALRLAPTTEVNDTKFMIDYVVLRRFDNKPVLGISIKGPSYERGYNSTYLQSGESRETRGHNAFKREHNAEVITVISHQTPSKDEQHIIRPLMNALRNAGY